MGKEVDGDTLEGFWDAITGTEPFTVCYDEMFNACYRVPGWTSPELLVIFLLELIFWIVALRWTWKKVRKNGRSPTEHHDSDRYDKGQS